MWKRYKQSAKCNVSELNVVSWLVVRERMQHIPIPWSHILTLGEPPLTSFSNIQGYVLALPM